MKRAAIALALSLAATALASAEVTYHEYHGTVYGSDGSEARRHNGDTYIRDRKGRETRCHEFARKVTCR